MAVEYGQAGEVGVHPSMYSDGSSSSSQRPCGDRGGSSAWADLEGVARLACGRAGVRGFGVGGQSRMGTALWTLTSTGRHAADGQHRHRPKLCARPRALLALPLPAST